MITLWFNKLQKFAGDILFPKIETNGYWSDGRIASYRSERRKQFKFGVYKKNEYADRINIHVRTLEKYLSEFSNWLAVWMLKRQNYNFMKSILELHSLEQIMCKARPIRISEVLVLVQCKDLKVEFIEYLVRKTHLSYELAPNKPSPIMYQGSNHGPYYAKLAEFVFIILSEYIVLHNYMWSSKLKTGNINSIDKFLRTY